MGAQAGWGGKPRGDRKKQASARRLQKPSSPPSSRNNTASLRGALLIEVRSVPANGPGGTGCCSWRANPGFARQRRTARVARTRVTD